MSNYSNNNISEKTEILYGPKNVMDILLQFLSKANTIDSCGDYKGSSVAIEAYKNLLVDLKTRGIKFRYVTDITKENINYCKELIEFSDEVRHLDGIKANFSVSETEYIATATLQEAKPVLQVIYSNVKDIIEQQKYVFETLWSKSIPAEQKIREIEEGLQPDVIEVIQNSNRAKELYLNLVKTATKEIMLIFPTMNAFIRQDKIGVIQSIRKAVKERSVKVRILMPVSNLTENTIRYITQEYNQSHQKHDYDNINNIVTADGIDDIDIRHIERMSETKATILIVDRKLSLVMELRDDSKTTFNEAIGLSTYSNSRPGVLSYIAIFDNLWIQTELYEKLKEANEQLKVHDKMQKEFINIASHEMKTPTQAILGYSELLQTHPERREEIIQAIQRNAARLRKLTSDLLDITRIESQSLRLNLERFNLNDFMSSVIRDCKSSLDSNNDNIKLVYNEPLSKGDLLIEADKGRLTQVISNLLDNAIKFTKKGTIFITSEKKDNHVIVSVKDSGNGIHPEIFPRLFSKFATKSETGTGLGLFISKSIIEAHSGGKIWAENNNTISGIKKEKGATFSFSLPLIFQQHIHTHEIEDE
ncbi:MAG TPA: HAMP domain-containing sensor histidine kinase [Nitrososphaeraceae archaeon]|nr:HAMP domain-containing sensor histidine kinase [Nitrososphaeraceae archaeon]